MTDTTSPTIVSFVADDASPTKQSTVDYHITFSEAVTGIDLSDFSLTQAGDITGASVASVTAVDGPDGTEYIVTVNTGLGSGTLDLNFNSAGATDLAGNQFTGGALNGPAGYTGYNFPQSIATGDFNGDGAPDLVMVNADQNHIATVLLGNLTSGVPNGTFGSPVEYGDLNAGISANSVAVGDVDGDGNLDIVIVSGQSATFSGHGEVDVLLGNGVGGFSVATKISAGFLATGLTLVDVNGDGKLDIIEGDVGPSSSSSNYEASVFLNQSTSGSATFSSALHYNVNTSPQSTAVADFDEDGKLDLAVMNTNSPPTLAIFKGTGQINTPFSTTASYSTGVASGNLFMLTGDVNGDMHADIIYGVNGSNVVHVLLGDGHGGFTTDNSYGVGNSPVGASLVDLNGDTFLDIVTSNYNGATVSVLFGNGDGTFQPSVSYAAGNQPRGIAVADFNGDGRPDIATATNGIPGAARVFLNTPPVIASADVYSVDRTPPDVTVGLAQDAGTSDSDLLTNNPKLTGTGDFNTSITVTVDGVDHTIQTDANGDWSYIPTGLTSGVHTVDVTQTDEVGNTTTVSGFQFTLDTAQPTLTGIDADTTPTNADQVQYTVHFSETITGLTTGNFSLTTSDTTGAQVLSVVPVDGNNKDYVVTVATGTTDGSLQLNFDGTGVHDLAGNALSGGAFPSAQNIAAAPPNQFYSLVAAGDLNGDGALDVVAENYIAHTATVLLGNADGTFTAGATFATGNDSSFFQNQLVLTDINGDGKLDLLALNFDDGTLSARLGNGDGTFGAESLATTPASPHSMAIGDFNGDGNIDVIVTGAENGKEAVSLLAGDGAGGFANAVDVGPTLNAQPNNIVAADFNGDGILDLVTPYGSINGLYVLLGNGSGGKGDGTFTVNQLTPGGGGPLNVAVGDFNGDGNIDIIVANSSGGVGGLLLLRGNGDGTFEAATAISTGGDVSSVDVVDVNGDGILDLVIGSTVTPHTPMVLLGNGSGGHGDGTFGPPSSAGFANAGGLAYGDFNGDGSIDIVSGGFGVQNLRLALGEPAAVSATEITIDRTSPTVTASGGTPLVAGETETITFTFDEDVQDFDNDDVAVIGGTLDTITAVDGSHYTATFTPDVTDNLAASIRVLADGVRGASWSDLAGNPGAGGNVLVITGDTKAPGPVTIALKTDSGVLASDHTTNTATLTGTADPNAVIHFKIDSNLGPTTVKASASGAWTFTPAVTEGSHTIKAYVVDAAGNETDSSVLSFTYDKTAPAISSISTTGTAPGPVTAGHAIHIQLNLSEGVALAIGNASTLKLSDGGIATFNAAGSSNQTLEYIYTPKANEIVADGSLKVVSLNATGANAFADTAGNALNIAGAANKAIHGLSIDTTDSGPTVTKIVASPASAFLHTGDKVTFTVTTDEKAFVTGTPVLTLDDGGVASYTKGSGSNTLTFSYTVGAGDTDTSALHVTGFDFTGGAAIKDLAGNSSDVSAAQATFANIHFDRTAPTVHGVTHVDDGALALGEKSIIKLDLGEAVKITGAPLLNLSDGVGTATYSAADSNLANGIVGFKFVATAGSAASSLEVNGVDLHGGTIKDLSGNAADLSGAPSDLHLIVDTTVPTVSNVSAVNVPADGLTKANSVGIDIKATEDIVITGAPTLKMSDGGFATLASLDADGKTMHFTYTPAKIESLADLTVTGMSIPSGGSIKDGAGNPLNMNGIAGFDLHMSVDTIAPTLKSIVATPSHSGPLFIGDTVDFTLHTSEHVNVDAGVELTLSNGGHATFSGQLTGDTVLFHYTVVSESTSDLKVVGIDQSGGDFTDLAGNALTAAVTLDTKTAVNLYAWKNGAGDFDDTAHWTQPSAPPSGAAVQIVAAGTYIVAATHDHDLGSLTTAKTVTLNIDTTTFAIHGTDTGANAGTISVVGDGSGTTLELAGVFKNSGAINIDDGSAAPATLTVLDDLTLSGGGKVNFLSNIAINNRIIVDGHDLTNVDNTISGAGHIQGNGNFVNQAKGIVSGSSPLTVEGDNGTAVLHVTNAGTMSSTGAGGLVFSNTDVANSNVIQASGTNAGVYFQSSALANTSKGTITASGINAKVVFDGATVSGGTLKTVGASAFVKVTENNAVATTFDGTAGHAVNVAGLVNLDDGATLNLEGTINNTGTIAIDTALGSLTTDMVIIADTLLSGAGAIKLANDHAGLISDGSDHILINAGNTISGAGILGDDHLTLINQAKGVINANTAAHTLTIDMDGAHHLSNAGLIEATAGGTLEIHSTDIDNTGTISSAAASSHVVLDDATITGGNITIAKGAFLETLGDDASVISGAKFTNAGTVHAGDGDLTIIGAVTNTGTLQVDGGSHLNITGAVTGTGDKATVAAGGTLELGAASNAAVTFLDDSGILQFDHASTAASKFTGSISGFIAGDVINLTDVNSASDSFTYSVGSHAGVLHVTDGAHTVDIAVKGDYTAAMFHVADDTHGHVNLTTDFMIV